MTEETIGRCRQNIAKCVDILRLTIVSEFQQIASVGKDRVGREPRLNGQIVQKSIHNTPQRQRFQFPTQYLNLSRQHNSVCYRQISTISSNPPIKAKISPYHLRKRFFVDILETRESRPHKSGAAQARWVSAWQSAFTSWQCKVTLRYCKLTTSRCTLTS